MKGMTTNVIYFGEKRAYLVKFLQKVFEKDTKEKALIVSKLNDLAFTLASRPPKSYMPENRPLRPNEIVLTLLDRKEKKNEYNFYISPNSMKIIENFAYVNFWQIFEQHMREINFLGYKVAVFNFMEQYELDESKYDMLIRRDRRHRSAMTPENSKKISSVFSV